MVLNHLSSLLKLPHNTLQFKEISAEQTLTFTAVGKHLMKPHGFTIMSVKYLRQEMRKPSLATPITVTKPPLPD